MWKITNIANGRKSCDNFDLESCDIPKVLSLLENKFEISYDNNGGIGFSLVGLDLQINGERVTIGWDNWSGIFVMSKESAGDVVIEKIYEFLKQGEQV